jgi:hypothetical protein
MARKKPSNGKADRSDPKSNKSLAIRHVLKKMPGAKANEMAAVVKRDYGHEVSKNMIYMVKAKTNMFADGRDRTQRLSSDGNPMNSAATWVDAIKAARALLKATGSVANATAMLKALDS